MRVNKILLLILIHLFCFAKPAGAASLSYPNGITETYTYDKSLDTVRISFSGTNQLPPMMALALKYGFPVQTSGNVTWGSNGTFGPGATVENNYTASITGLKKYVTAKRNYNSLGTVPPKLQQELETEVTKIINAGHLRPAIFITNWPGSDPFTRGMVNWIYTGETYQYLAEAYPLLSDILKTSVRSYLSGEYNAGYKPEEKRGISLGVGADRFAVTKDANIVNSWSNNHSFRINGIPHVWNLYGLAKYYEIIGGTPSVAVMTNAKNIINNEFNTNNLHWESMYWRSGQAPENNAVHVVNQLFAGLVGYIRLTELAGSSYEDEQNKGWGLLAKTAALRFAMGKYTQYDWERGSRPQGMDQYPNDSTWWAKYRAQSDYEWVGNLISFNWPQTGGLYNTRQVFNLSEGGVEVLEWMSIGDKNGSTGWKGVYLLPFADMTPELGRFMKDYLKPETQMFVDRILENQPHWYMAYPDAILGLEEGYMLPISVYGTFLAYALILDAPPAELADYTDFPWLARGDYFYLSKLSETIKKYKGVSWDDAATSPVGIIDLRLILANFYSIFDINNVIARYGK